MLPSVSLRVLCGLCLLLLSVPTFAQYLGFDRNDYPGDSNLATLHQTFSYTGYWLNNAPGESSNSWSGKRSIIQAAGFGFLVLFNGRLDAELHNNPTALGRSDGQAAASAATHEGFSPHTIIFLDIEEGGRMLPEQKAYIYSWVDAVTAAGFRAGVYCSGIPAKEGKLSIITANDIQQNSHGREIAYFVANDACPPSPGCTSQTTLTPAQSRVPFARAWQFAQSPRRPEFAAKCLNYNHDGNCYPPRIDPAQKLQIDLDFATSSDPSNAR